MQKELYKQASIWTIWLIGRSHFLLVWLNILSPLQTGTSAPKVNWGET